jgi:hypothetical protein
MMSRTAPLRAENPVCADLAILSALVFLTLWVRLSTQMMIHTGVDERDYWYAAKALSQGFPYPALTHRTVRWAIILPVAAIQKLFGVHPNVYYIAPILNALCQTALLFALGTRLGGRRVGALAALMLVFFPYQIRAASQVRPEIFSITYMLMCALPLVSALRSSGRRRAGYLLAASVALFLAYETKITNLFFLPGIFVLLLFFGGRGIRAGVRDCLVFGLPLLALFLAETAVYAALTEYRFGQLSVIQANHLSSDYAAPLNSYLEVFKRYTPRYLEPYWQLPFVLFALACVPLLRARRRAELKAIAILGLSFFFFITFTITGAHPIMVAEDFINRYFCSVLPFVFVAVAWAIVRTLDRFTPALSRRWAEAGVGPYVLGCLAASALVSVAFTLPFVPKSARQYAHSPARPAEHPFAETARYYPQPRPSRRASLRRDGPVLPPVERSLGFRRADYLRERARRGKRKPDRVPFFPVDRNIRKSSCAGAPARRDRRRNRSSRFENGDGHGRFVS